MRFVDTIAICKEMAIKCRVIRLFIDQYKDNKRECPFYSELKGIEQVLDIMGIEYSYGFDLENMKRVSVTVEGHTEII